LDTRCSGLQGGEEGGKEGRGAGKFWVAHQSHRYVFLAQALMFRGNIEEGREERVEGGQGG